MLYCVSYMIIHIVNRDKKILKNYLFVKGDLVYYTKKHRGGCTRGLLRPGSLITNLARSVRFVIRD